MKEKDHIEDYFKKYLEQYEESPDENFWARVAPAIEVQKERNNRKVLWILLLLLSLLLTGFLVRSIAWDRDFKFEKEEERTPIVMDNVLTDDPLDIDNKTPILRIEKPVQEEVRVVEKLQKTQFIEEEQLNSIAEKESIEAIPPLIELEDHKVVGGVTTSISGVPKLQQQEMEALPDKIATLNYVAPELPKTRRPLTVQPYVSLNSYQGQSVFYEGTRRFGAGTVEQISFNPINNTSLNLGIDAGVIINQQLYVQLGFNQNFSELTYKGTVNKDLSEQEIAILADGVPINFDFTMDTYFDEIEGKLKLRLKTSEIEAGKKDFSIAAQRKVQTTRWMLATAYKIDINDVIRLIPKIGINQVTTQYQEYQEISGEEIRLDPEEQRLESQLNVEASQTSMNEEIQLKNMEGILGFQAEIPLSRSRKWLIVPTGELWFDLTPSLEQTNLTLKKSVLTLGASLRYNIN